MEYENRIITLLRELTEIVGDIGDVLWKINYQKLKENAGQKFKLIDKLKEGLKMLIDETWDVIDELELSINNSIQIKDLDTISNEIKKLVENSRRVGHEYKEAEERNSLSDGAKTNLSALLNNLSKLSSSIEHYNSQFTPKLKSLKTILKEIKIEAREISDLLYEEIFGKD